MVCAGLTLPRSSGMLQQVFFLGLHITQLPDYSLVYYFSIWFCLILLSLGYIFAHGVEYVAWPRLNPPIEAIYYSGPGFRSGRRGLWSLRTRRVVSTLTQRKRANSRLEEVEMGSTKKRVD